MENWRKMTIGDLCITISETYHGNDAEVILINTSDVLEGTILNHKKVPNQNLKGQFKKTFKKDDILYSEIRPANKRYAFVDFENTEHYIASTKLMVLRPNTEVILPRFLLAYLSSGPVLSELQHLAETRSGTFPQITFSSELAPMPISVPDFQTQKKIVGVLDSIEEKIKNNIQINKNLFEQAQALYKDRYIDLSPFYGKIPDGWHIGSVSEIIELHDSKRIPLSSREREKLDKIYPYYGATSVMDYVDHYLFDGIYLLLGEDGTVIDDKGFPILQYVEGKFWVNNHAHIITGKCGFTVELLYLLFSLTNVKLIVTGAVQPKISQANLNKVSVLIPDAVELKSFDSLIQPFFAQIRNLRAENDRLATLRDTLLPRLMSGEIDVSDIDL